MLLKYLEVCEKYFKSKGIDFPSDYSSFNTFVENIGKQEIHAYTVYYVSN